MKQGIQHSKTQTLEYPRLRPQSQPGAPAFRDPTIRHLAPRRPVPALQRDLLRLLERHQHGVHDGDGAGDRDAPAAGGLGVHVRGPPGDPDGRPAGVAAVAAHDRVAAEHQAGLPVEQHEVRVADVLVPDQHRARPDDLDVGDVAAEHADPWDWPGRWRTPCYLFLNRVAGREAFRYLLSAD